jgi:hypothetical protein
MAGAHDGGMRQTFQPASVARLASVESYEGVAVLIVVFLHTGLVERLQMCGAGRLCHRLTAVPVVAGISSIFFPLGGLLF